MHEGQQDDPHFTAIYPTKGLVTDGMSNDREGSWHEGQAEGLPRSKEGPPAPATYERRPQRYGAFASFLSPFPSLLRTDLQPTIYLSACADCANSASTEALYMNADGLGPLKDAASAQYFDP